MNLAFVIYVKAVHCFKFNKHMNMRRDDTTCCMYIRDFHFDVNDFANEFISVLCNLYAGILNAWLCMRLRKEDFVGV